MYLSTSQMHSRLQKQYFFPNKIITHFRLILNYDLFLPEYVAVAILMYFDPGFKRVGYIYQKKETRYSKVYISGFKFFVPLTSHKFTNKTVKYPCCMTSFCFPPCSVIGLIFLLFKGIIQKQDKITAIYSIFYLQ